VAFTVIDQGKDPSKAYALVGGLDAWQAAGYPMGSGG
jgi:rhodanese-related sulfurtransferase